MLHVVHANRSTTLFPLVTRMAKAESKRILWERGLSEEAKFEEYKTGMHPLELNPGTKR